MTPADCAPLCDYRYNTSTRDELTELLGACDESFVPPLRGRVDLDSYASKLFDHATSVEAWDGPVLVGVIATYLNDRTKGFGFVSNVCVRPKYSGNGIATELLRLSIEEAARRDFSRLQLEVSPANAVARAFYSRNGFIVISNSADSVTMELIIEVAGSAARQNRASL